ncbi:MAG: nitroreductase family deazaflavin-dependent oxidoreductase [Salinibacterium sp.]|nr:nitroreductase family deazaflavin-dependent oxidoreductase [Salinibacterium sp.]
MSVYRPGCRAGCSVALVNWNDSIIAEFRENQGRVERFGGPTLLLLHTTGAKTGEPRVSPMMYFAEPEGLFVVASKGGAPENPAWFHNLTAHPEVTVEQATADGIVIFDAIAETVDAAKRTTLFSRLSERAPGFASYQQKTDRIIPVVQLHPLERNEP